MIFTIFSVLYVLIAAAMIVLILMQRGDGANAGASFGGGSTGTVFGARGAASFLTRTTAVLAALFFILTIGMGMYLSHHGVRPNQQQALGIMAGAGSTTPATSKPASAAGAPASAPAASAPAKQPAVPGAPTSASGRGSEVPTAPAKTSAPAAAAPAKAPPSGGKPASGSPPSSAPSALH